LAVKDGGFDKKSVQKKMATFLGISKETPFETYQKASRKGFSQKAEFIESEKLGCVDKREFDSLKVTNPVPLPSSLPLNIHPPHFVPALH
jgi:hypothetical protein